MHKRALQFSPVSDAKVPKILSASRLRSYSPSPPLSPGATADFPIDVDNGYGLDFPNDIDIGPEPCIEDQIRNFPKEFPPDVEKKLLTRITEKYIVKEYDDWREIVKIHAPTYKMMTEVCKSFYEFFHGTTFAPRNVEACLTSPQRANYSIRINGYCDPNQNPASDFGQIYGQLVQDLHPSYAWSGLITIRCMSKALDRNLVFSARWLEYLMTDAAIAALD